MYYLYNFLGDKERHKLPHDSKVIHAEFTYYYYPGDVAFPCKSCFDLNSKISNNIIIKKLFSVPPSKFYAQLNPVQMNFDALTVLWLNTFALNVYKSLMTTNVANQDNLGNMIYFDILIEAIMPRVSNQLVIKIIINFKNSIKNVLFYIQILFYSLYLKKKNFVIVKRIVPNH